MTACVNKIILVGYLGKDPEQRFTQSGRPVTSFTLATSESWKVDDGEREQHTEWFNVVAWNRLAEVCKTYLGKGSRVYLEGRVQSRSYETENGKQRTLEVVASVVKMLDSAKNGNSSASKKSEAALDNDELPVFEGDSA
jgi:single-strand DNA-binding protein